MSKARKLPGPLWRPVVSGKWSRCGSAELTELDWDNWWQDEFEGTYLHVRKDTEGEGETWHRVEPRNLRQRVCTRVAIGNGNLFWLFDVKEAAK